MYYNRDTGETARRRPKQKLEVRDEPTQDRRLDGTCTTASVPQSPPISPPVRAACNVPDGIVPGVIIMSSRRQSMSTVVTAEEEEEEEEALARALAVSIAEAAAPATAFTPGHSLSPESRRRRGAGSREQEPEREQQTEPEPEPAVSQGSPRRAQHAFSLRVPSQCSPAEAQLLAHLTEEAEAGQASGLGSRPPEGVPPELKHQATQVRTKVPEDEAKPKVHGCKLSATLDLAATTKHHMQTLIELVQMFRSQFSSTNKHEARQCLVAASWDLPAASKQHEQMLIAAVMDGSDLTEAHDARYCLEHASWNADRAIALRAEAATWAAEREMVQQFRSQFPSTHKEEARQCLVAASWDLPAASKQHKQMLIAAVIDGSDLTEEELARYYLEHARWNADRAVRNADREIATHHRSTGLQKAMVDTVMTQFPSTNEHEARQCLVAASWDLPAASKQHKQTLIAAVIDGSDLTEKEHARYYLEHASWNADRAIALRAEAQREMVQQFRSQFPSTDDEEARQYLVAASWDLAAASKQHVHLEQSLERLMWHKENVRDPSCLTCTFAQSNYKAIYDRCGRPRDAGGRWEHPLTRVRDCLPQAFDRAKWDQAVERAADGRWDSEWEHAGNACTRLWTSGPACRLINQVIMNDKEHQQLEHMMPFIRCMNDYLLHCGQRLETSLTVYRTSRLTPADVADITIGTVYRIGMYVATTKSRQALSAISLWQSGEAGFKPMVEWEFTIPAGCWQVRDISSASVYDKEDEVTMVPYTAVRIVNILEHLDGKMTIYADVLCDASRESEALATILA